MPREMTPQQAALRKLAPWATEMQADWATMLTRVADVQNDLEPVVASIMGRITLDLDALVANIAAYTDPQAGKP